MRMKTIGVRTALAAATLLTLVGTAGSAATAAPAHTSGTSLAGSCPVTAWGHTGHYRCGTHVEAVDWDEDGRTDEVFVIAPSRTIWHTWASAGGWKEMPGHGRADDMVGSAETGNARSRCIIVHVDGSSYGYWQNCYSHGRWHNWTTVG